MNQVESLAYNLNNCYITYKTNGGIDNTLAKLKMAKSKFELPQFNYLKFKEEKK